jgi:hypothetical protein
MHGSKQDTALGGVTTGVSSVFLLPETGWYGPGARGMVGHGATLCERLWSYVGFFVSEGKGPKAHVSYVPYT